MPRFKRRLLEAWLRVGGNPFGVFWTDVFSLFLAVYCGYAFRLTVFFGWVYLDDLFPTAGLLILFVSGTLLLGGLYRVLWSQASLEEYLRFTRFYALGAFFYCLVDRFLITNIFVPRTTLAVLVVLGLFFTGAFRISWRLARLGLQPQRLPLSRAIIVGAGEAGGLLARDLLRNDREILPLGFVDDDSQKMGMEVAGLRVLGPTSNLLNLIDEYHADLVLFAIPSAPGRMVSRILAEVAPKKITVRVLPSLRELAGGQVNVSRLRPVRLEDLLAREPISLDNAGIRNYLEDRTVLVTGAGGSIGREICQQVAEYGPKKMLLLGHGEQSIYELLESFKNAGVKVPYIPVILDVADRKGMEFLFREYRPQVIFHAAAHKHVPLMESNPREAFRVNALGTWTVANLAGTYGTERMVLISSDKAVNPANVMGATKRLGEMLLEEAQERYESTAFMAVRFGNVLGSRGSVIPKFEQQILKGGPVTVTDPGMRRYFMLTSEAVSLVLQAASLGKGGELFVLDMGEPVQIVELAKTLIRLYGMEPHRDIPIVFTGKRPGEKLFEELFYDPAHVTHTMHRKIFLTSMQGKPASSLAERLEWFMDYGDREIREVLEEYVPFFEARESQKESCCS
ncbi:MAG TPA: nucleoside-diphosphate sugar epimerase/dehydratase [Synergistaceae bacterium]|nr:nucleoside-diphosphate sugar epimerase/dehydratase [Synergistaceae bacterium]HPJ26377.1 nucleoside-diphosphate sugar epimerase/dehydratase [Synergistaceae bacterium]HPQ38252.1 nucleoside-diphosphate sugar epimerase/dehydratase [Synergistaceae bacterium]